MERGINILLALFPLSIIDLELDKSVQADAWIEKGITRGKIITDIVSEVQ